MSLTLYFHPLSSFCHKVLIALYENEVPFKPLLVDFFNEESVAAFKKVWPIAQFPVLLDDANGETIPESSIIIEYLDRKFPGQTRLIPSDPELALGTRSRDRFFDLHVHVQMQKIVTDRLRPAGTNDSTGVEQAKARLRTALDIADKDLQDKMWAAGDSFTMADCAAAPALFYANKVMPFGESHRNVAAYFDRLVQRPSYARVLEEAQPYMKSFPGQK
jgi:glutathione S-transferase